MSLLIEMSNFVMEPLGDHGAHLISDIKLPWSNFLRRIPPGDCFCRVLTKVKFLPKPIINTIFLNYQMPV